MRGWRHHFIGPPLWQCEYLIETEVLLRKGRWFREARLCDQAGVGFRRAIADVILRDAFGTGLHIESNKDRSAACRCPTRS